MYKKAENCQRCVEVKGFEVSRPDLWVRAVFSVLVGLFASAAGTNSLIIILVELLSPTRSVWYSAWAALVSACLLILTLWIRESWKAWERDKVKEAPVYRPLAADGELHIHDASEQIFEVGDGWFQVGSPLKDGRVLVTRAAFDLSANPEKCRVRVRPWAAAWSVRLDRNSLPGIIKPVLRNNLEGTELGPWPVEDLLWVVERSNRPSALKDVIQGLIERGQEAITWIATAEKFLSSPESRSLARSLHGKWLARALQNIPRPKGKELHKSEVVEWDIVDSRQPSDELLTRFRRLAEEVKQEARVSAGSKS